MEVANIYTVKGEPMKTGGEHKTILSSGDRVKCYYYTRPPNLNKDVMEGAHSHKSEAVIFVISGELEYNVNGETVMLKKGDALLLPYDAMMGAKTIGTTPSELLVVSCSDASLEKLKSA